MQGVPEREECFGGAGVERGSRVVGSREKRGYGRTPKEGAEVAPSPQQAEETAAAFLAAPLAKLLRGEPQEPSSAPGGPGCPGASFPPAPHLGCREHPPPLPQPPGKRLPRPAGGRTQARSPARGSPGERGAESILPESHGPRVRAGGGDLPACSPASSRSPRPTHRTPTGRPVAPLTCWLAAAASGPPAARPWPAPRGSRLRSRPGPSAFRATGA